MNDRMRGRRWPALGGAVLAVLAAVGGRPLPGQEARTWDRYRILIDRNMFLRDRSRARPVAAPRTAEAPPAPADSDQRLVLRGVARRDGVHVAFFEDTRAETLRNVRAGDAIGQGRAKAIRIEGVEYERGGKVRTVLIGTTLAGGAPPALPAPPARAKPPAPKAPSAAPPRATTGPATAPGTQTTQPAQPTTQPAAPPAPGPASEASESETNDILERMRRRRERELRR